MSDSTPIKNRLIPAGAQMMSAWLVPRALPHGGDVFENDGFKMRGWDETGLHVGSVRRFGSSIGTLVTADADVARKPAEVNVEARCFE